MSEPRKIIQINEERCDGCGQCANACAEGAIQIVDGKARLVSDVYCDGLGACIGECPQNAIELVERPAVPFDPQAVLNHHLEQDRKARDLERGIAPAKHHVCPGTAARSLERPKQSEPNANENAGEPRSSKLGNWPVQLRLVPVHAPWFEGAKVLVAGDCTPFAYHDFHETFMEDRTVLVGCPKLDDPELYLRKLTELFRQQKIDSVEVVVMEVPCCGGLVNLVRQAIEASGKKYKLTTTRIAVQGEILDRNESTAGEAEPSKA